MDVQALAQAHHRAELRRSSRALERGALEDRDLRLAGLCRSGDPARQRRWLSRTSGIRFRRRRIGPCLAYARPRRLQTACERDRPDPEPRPERARPPLSAGDRRRRSRRQERALCRRRAFSSRPGPPEPRPDQQRRTFRDCPLRDHRQDRHGQEQSGGCSRGGCRCATHSPRLHRPGSR